MNENGRIKIIVRPLTLDDLEDVRALESRCFGYTWPEDQYKKEIQNSRVARYMVARHNGILAGFAGAWFILDEIHVTTIAVNPDFRGYRIGKMLMWHIFFRGLEEKCRWSTLEVNTKNESALRIYNAFGFKTIGERKSYYSDGEDALVMWTKIHTPAFTALMQKIKEEWEEKLCLSWE